MTTTSIPTTYSCTYCQGVLDARYVPEPPICPGCAIDALQPGKLSSDEMETEHLAGWGPGCQELLVGDPSYKTDPERFGPGAAHLFLGAPGGL